MHCQAIWPAVLVFCPGSLDWEYSGTFVYVFLPYLLVFVFSFFPLKTHSPFLFFLLIGFNFCVRLQMIILQRHVNTVSGQLISKQPLVSILALPDFDMETLALCIVSRESLGRPLLPGN
jgi:phosphate starvation-inducible membrane PsiE